MPAKSIYIKASDERFWDDARRLGINLPELISEAIRKAVDEAQTPEKRMILELIQSIDEDMATAKTNGAGRAVISEFKEAKAVANTARALVRDGQMTAAAHRAVEAHTCHLHAKYTAAKFDALVKLFKERLSSSNGDVARSGT